MGQREALESVRHFDRSGVLGCRTYLFLHWGFRVWGLVGPGFGFDMYIQGSS